MKKCFLTGLILLLPFVISILILLWLVDLLTNPFLGLAESFLLFREGFFFLKTHPRIAVFITRALILIFLFFFTLLLGFLGRKYLFSQIIHRIQTFFLKAPLIRVIYKLCHDVTKATFSADSKLFKETVLVPFPHANSSAVGLVIGPIPDSLKQGGLDIEIAVFVPTSPHPISGFILLIHPNQVKSIQLSTEEAFQYIISCGTISDSKK